MKTKKALAGLFGLFGSLAAVFPRFPAPALLLFSLSTNPETNMNLMTNSADLIFFIVDISIILKAKYTRIE